MQVVKRNGSREALDLNKINAVIEYACDGLDVSVADVKARVAIMFYDGISTKDIHKAVTRAASELISREKQDYTYVAARLLLQQAYKEVTGGQIEYPHLGDYLAAGVAEGRLSAALMSEAFDIEELNRYVLANTSRDLQFDYVGLQTVYDRYLIRRKPRRDQDKGDLIEMPQHMWMRIAMGLALNEKPQHRTHYAKAFYDMLSTFTFINSTPTLFNSGTIRPQMSSCYLNSVHDQVGQVGESAGIFPTITECANLSKWAGGIGTDWTRVRPAGDVIHGTSGKSSGVVPYLKIYNDTAVAVNQGGKRNGAFAAYLEPWHGDVERFIDLKKNVGEERLRAREIFTAGWFPDLFFERLDAEADWSLFSPKECPDLVTTYGDEFKAAYERYEAEGKAIKTIPATELWRKWLTALWESGGPWITFKDEANRRSPQKHVGVVRSSNLCTEITLVANDEETAVCNLGSINASKVGDLSDPVALNDFRDRVHLAMRMLDNVIDLNFYPSEKARRSNMRHRPVGLGVMGWSEYLMQNDVDWESEEHLELTDKFFEAMSYFAIEGSAMLAEERGKYSSYEGSDWSKGIFPIDTARDLPFANQDNKFHLVDCAEGAGEHISWDALRQYVQMVGMRNSNTMAIAPTATIANITGTTPCIEPPYRLELTKENHSGTFQVIDPVMRYGKDHLCKEAFDVDQEWVIKAAAVRQKWIDQSQSVNLFAAQGTRGRDLDKWFRLAHRLGLKTVYYLKRQVNELDDKKIEVPKVESLLVSATEEQLIVMAEQHDKEVKMCSIDNPDCESCQ